jgi:hypothetical protein
VRGARCVRPEIQVVRGAWCVVRSDPRRDRNESSTVL